MEFIVDYEHIFFDRYTLEENEKKKEALDIVKKIFKDKLNIISSDTLQIDISPCGAEEEILFEKTREKIKREFFLRLIPAMREVEEEKKEPLTEKAQRYINANYLYAEFSPDELCDCLEVSRKVIDRAFETSFGKTVTEYVKEMRIDCAKGLIKENNTLEVVADICGFGSVKTMQRAFKSTLGKTPGMYRHSQLDSEGME